MSIRPTRRIIEAKPPLKGAGTRPRLAFGFSYTSDFDPFLLLDDFRNENSDGYETGIHILGIKTITYVLKGTVDHGDSMGNKGSLGAGDVQWMTARSGILHNEMPQGDEIG